MKEPKDDKSITPDTDTWKFKSREVPIDEMDKVSVLYAALHCHKRMYYYNNQVRSCNSNLKKEEDDRTLASLERRKKKSEDIMLFFAGKLEQLEERAIDIGFEIPEKYEGIKNLLSEVEKEEKKERN